MNKNSGSSMNPAVVCGVDIEYADSLPDTADFSTHPFYNDNFTNAEITYCIAQLDPRVHFTARWCAKEAVKKCIPSLISVDNRCLEIRKLPSGAPYIVLVTPGGQEPLGASLSLSHAGRLAIAMVVAQNAASSASL